MKIKNQQDFFSGLLFFGVGLAFAYGSTHYAMGSSTKPGPGYFPMILSVMLALLGCAVIFKSLTIAAHGDGLIGPIAWRVLSVVVAAIVVFGLAMPRWGLLVTVPVLVTLVSLAGQEFKWISVVLTSVVLTAFAWAVFVVGLKLNLPL
jgi:Tripartite tricarboxylate transporter TctB family